MTSDDPVPPVEEAIAPPPPPPEPLRPTTASERVETIDILRGLALFGILAANIRAFSGPAITYFTPNLFWPQFHNRLAQAFIDTFVQGKFIAIFAFLFGVGFAVQFDRAMARAASFRLRFAWRMFLLLLIGLIHGLLIWFGDILLAYALDGLLLLVFARRREKTIKIWAAIFLLFIPLILTAAFVAGQLGVPLPAGGGPKPEAIAHDANVYENGSYAEVTEQRMGDAVKYNWGMVFIFGWYVQGLFLLGLLAWRKGFFKPAPESLPRYRRWMYIGFAVGITGNVLVTLHRWLTNPPQAPVDVPTYVFGILQFVATPFLSLGYICLVVLICQSAAMRARLHRFAAVGRTALTNYLMQSIVGTLIFAGYGLGLFYGEAGPAWLLPLTFVIYIAQMYVSSWWLERFRFGPVEWAWRRMTYGGPLPMRREAAGIPQAALVTAPPEG